MSVASGRLILMHTPAGFWLVALLFVLIAFWRRSRDPFSPGRWLVFAALTVTVLAVVSGFFEIDSRMAPRSDMSEVRTLHAWNIAAFVLGVFSAASVGLEVKSRSRRVRTLELLLLVITTSVAAFGTSRGPGLLSL